MIRIAVAAVVAILLFTKVITGIFAIVLAVLAAVFVLTSVVSICPLYSIVGLSTCPVKEQA